MLLILLLGLSSFLEILNASPTIDSKPSPQVLTYTMDTANMPNSYKFHYDTSNGSSRTEQGDFQKSGNGDPALNVRGAVRWYDDKGHLYQMTYKAGRRGYRTIIKKLS